MKNIFLVPGIFQARENNFQGANNFPDHKTIKILASGSFQIAKQEKIRLLDFSRRKNKKFSPSGKFRDQKQEKFRSWKFPGSKTRRFSFLEFSRLLKKVFFALIFFQALNYEKYVTK